MIPVPQIYDCDCLSAVIASLLELPLDQVPLFDSKVDGRFVGQHEVLNRWLAERGMTFLDIPVNGQAVSTCRVPWNSTKATWCVITLKFPGTRSPHCVVGSARNSRIRVAFDPYTKPDRVSAKGRPTSVGFLIPLDAGKWEQKSSDE